MYFVHEYQKNNDGSCAVINYHDDSWDYNNAVSVWHDKCKYAAVSNLPIHTIILTGIEGVIYKTETFNHGVASNGGE